MTARVHSLTVVLEENVREDDIADLQRAIGMMRNVADVGLNIADPGAYMAESRARQEWGLMLLRLGRAGLDPERFETVKRLLTEES